MVIENKDGKTIVLAIVKTIQENKEYLSEIDGLIGDGDHGINMNKGFTMFEEKIRDTDMDLTVSLRTLGRTLLGDIGGSMGPLYGTFFIEMSKQTKDIDKIDKQVFANMLEAALAGIQSLGNAKVGDKTLVDTLEPAFTAFQKALTDGKDFSECLADMKNAAIAGRDSTKDLVAKIGRASRLGERSRGVLDAGATSCCLILCAMADAIAN